MVINRQGRAPAQQPPGSWQQLMWIENSLVSPSPHHRLTVLIFCAKVGRIMGHWLMAEPGQQFLTTLLIAMNSSQSSPTRPSAQTPHREICLNLLVKDRDYDGRRRRGHTDPLMKYNKYLPPSCRGPPTTTQNVGDFAEIATWSPPTVRTRMIKSEIKHCQNKWSPDRSWDLLIPVFCCLLVFNFQSVSCSHKL